MKRLFITTVAALTLLGSLGPVASAATGDWRDPNHQAQWDPSHHNGYWYQNKWHYGAPPAAYNGKPGLQYGWHQWRKGDRISTDERSRYAEIDYRSHHLRHPPRGYRWVQDDRGNFLLAAVATGVIADLIINSH